jgi:hypothetical protein
MMPILLMSSPAVAADSEDVDRDANATLTLLYQTTPAALRLAPHAKAILMFPASSRPASSGAPSMATGAPGRGGKTTGYYDMTAASCGQRAGVQSLSSRCC